MASKSKRRRRVLGASCILAALIIAGSSFAWFTSKDEVTNRLTATADYGVSIVEDFTPPKDMTPGQTVNKDVSVVNTGSVAAFTRVSLSDEINYSRLNSVDLNTAYKADGSKTVFMQSDGTTKREKAMTNETTSATATDGDTYLYDLRVFGAVDPTFTDANVTLNPMEKTNKDGTKTANEVSTLMAGGRVIVAASKAVAPEYQSVRSGDDINGTGTGYEVIYTDGIDYYIYSTADSAYKIVTLNDDGEYANPTAATPAVANLSVYALARDYSGTQKYKVEDTGLYLFERTDGSYSGFYYKAASGGDPAVFYALKTEEADSSNGKNTAKLDGVTVQYDTGKNDKVVKSVTGVKLLTKESGITNTDGTWTVSFLKSDKLTATTTPNDSTNGAAYMKATYHKTSDVDGTSGDPVTNRDIVFFIKLDDNWKDNWAYVADDTTPKNGTTNDGIGYFYYKETLKSGVTSEKLIDSVELSGGMTASNYIDLVYDLKVALDSVQVTKDENGNETYTAAAVSGWATPTLTKGGDGVIDSIDWA